jgi:uncharacterized coiled-coil protein SlyX
MFGKILKALVVAAGVGFAIGVAAGKRHPSEENPGSKNSPDGPPPLDRLDRIESRITAFEAEPVPVTDTELDLRIRVQSKDIEALRLQLNEYRQRIASDAALIQKGLADITKSIPALLESIVAPRVDDLRLRLQLEAQQSVDASLTTFERAIEEKTSHRIAALEKVMLDQSALLTALGHRAIESDMNVERLIAAVGRLCDRTNESPELPRKADFTGLAA